MKNSGFRRMASCKPEGFGAHLRRWEIDGMIISMEHHDNGIQTCLSIPYCTGGRDEWYDIWTNGVVLEVYPSCKRKWRVKVYESGKETRLPIWKIWKMLWELKMKGNEVLVSYGL